VNFFVNVVIFAQKPVAALPQFKNLHLNIGNETYESFNVSCGNKAAPRGEMSTTEAGPMEKILSTQFQDAGPRPAMHFARFQFPHDSN